MGILCKLFGHRTSQYNHLSYSSFHAVDNIRREHCSVLAVCIRCEREFNVGRIHLKKRKSESNLEKELGACRILLRKGLDI